jgi:hypothetical protein
VSANESFDDGRAAKQNCRSHDGVPPQIHSEGEPNQGSDDESDQRANSGGNPEALRPWTLSHRSSLSLSAADAQRSSIRQMRSFDSVRAAISGRFKQVREGGESIGLPRYHLRVSSQAVNPVQVLLIAGSSLLSVLSVVLLVSGNDKVAPALILFSALCVLASQVLMIRHRRGCRASGGAMDDAPDR